MSKIVTLPGTLPGLLATYAPIVVPFGTPTNMAGMPGVVVGVVEKQLRVCIVGKVLLYNPEELRLNLSTPEGMCHAKMWLATRLGAVAPSDVSFWRTRDPYGRWTDRLRPYDLVADGRHVAMFVDREVGVAGFKRGFSIPGLSNMSYPEVVAAACLAVGGAS